MIKRLYNFLFRKLVVEPRIKKYLFHHLSKEDQEMLCRWHSDSNVLKKTKNDRYYIMPSFSWQHGMKNN
jgi:hypothetical protein